MTPDEKNCLFDLCVQDLSSDYGSASMPPVKQTPNAAAIKHSKGKPRHDLLLTPGGTLIARALQFGGVKYQDAFNYARGEGLSYTDLARAAAGHIAAFLQCEELDPESGLPHLAHAGASVKMLLDLVVWNRGIDDRFDPEVKEVDGGD